MTGADAAVLVTEWDEFKELDFGAVAAGMSGNLIIDGRNALDPEAVARRRADLRGHRAIVRRLDMQAVILVGGEGTRLRPLTSTVPKPVVPLVDRPFIAYMLEWLARHGVDDVIMSLRLPGRPPCATCSATARSTGCGCASSRSPSRAAPPAR